MIVDLLSRLTQAESHKIEEEIETRSHVLAYSCGTVVVDAKCHDWPDALCNKSNLIKNVHKLTRQFNICSPICCCQELIELYQEILKS